MPDLSAGTGVGAGCWAFSRPRARSKAAEMLAAMLVTGEMSLVRALVTRRECCRVVVQEPVSSRDVFCCSRMGRVKLQGEEL